MFLWNPIYQIFLLWTDCTFGALSKKYSPGVTKIFYFFPTNFIVLDFIFRSTLHSGLNFYTSDSLENTGLNCTGPLMRGFSSVNAYYTTTCFVAVDAEPWICKADSKVTQRFSTAQRLRTPNPCQGSTGHGPIFFFFCQKGQRKFLVFVEFSVVFVYLLYMANQLFQHICWEDYPFFSKFPWHLSHYSLMMTPPLWQKVKN